MPHNTIRSRKMAQICRETPNCTITSNLITNLSEYFEVLSGQLGDDRAYWFRGQSDLTRHLIPSALRFAVEDDRNKALALLADFKRLVEIRIDRPPLPDDNLKWVQLAQHYGLPTRLLDWTQNAAIALFFACSGRLDRDGVVYVLNPIDLNREAYPRSPRVFDAHLDSGLINPYLELRGNIRPRVGKKTIAIFPIHNSERIMLQLGVFTLHGDKTFGLDGNQAPSLVGIPILKNNKAVLLNELERVGVNEMALFPEPEHVANYLKRALPCG